MNPPRNIGLDKPYVVQPWRIHERAKNTAPVVPVLIPIDKVLRRLSRVELLDYRNTTQFLGISLCSTFATFTRR